MVKELEKVVLQIREGNLSRHTTVPVPLGPYQSAEMADQEFDEMMPFLEWLEEHDREFGPPCAAVLKGLLA